MHDEADRGLDGAGVQDAILGGVPVDRHLGQLGLVDDDQEIVVGEVAVLHPAVAGVAAEQGDLQDPDGQPRGDLLWAQAFG